jgi:hypothetical protein
MISIIIILIILLPLVWLLVAPIELIINSKTGEYSIMWKGIAGVRLVPIPGNLLLRFNILLWRKEIDPIEELARPKEKPKSPKKKKKKKSRSNKWLSFQKIKRKGVRLLKSFRVKALRLNLDTGDFVYNSYLYPVFYFLDRGKRRISINYEGESEVLFIAENRLYRMLIAVLF